MEDRPDKIRPALFGGLTIAIISTVPGLSLINCACCAGVMLGGFIAVHFYNKSLSEREGMLLTYNDGAILGLLSGAFGAVIGTLFSSVIGTNLKQQIDKMLEYSGDLPPELEEALFRLSEFESDFVLIAIGLFMSLVLYCIFATIGGIIAVSVFTKKKVA